MSSMVNILVVTTCLFLLVNEMVNSGFVWCACCCLSFCSFRRLISNCGLFSHWGREITQTHRTPDMLMLLVRVWCCWWLLEWFCTFIFVFIYLFIWWTVFCLISFSWWPYNFFYQKRVFLYNKERHKWGLIKEIDNFF